VHGHSNEGKHVIQYRQFRNTDPPGLAMVWNEAFTARGSAPLRHSSPLENYVFHKPYFDPAGLIVAIDNGQFVGFVHAAFGPNVSQTEICRNAGVICLIGVRPAYRRRSVGSELLRRAEAYLKDRGAQTLYAGCMAPLDPFYFGLYGGSEMPGFLASDPETSPFLERHGYRVCRTAHVFQRLLNQPLSIVDGRFPQLRRRFEVRIAPRSGPGTWWQECVLGPIELVDFRLEEKSTGNVAARTSVWEMDGFSWRWNQPAVGVLDAEVKEDLRRQGLAKYLLSQMLRYLQEQFFGAAEVHASEGDEAAMKLFEGLGFEKVDTGHLYKKE
jgi:ribosomal protein S18 acetylase RimI-like enzyme